MNNLDSIQILLSLRKPVVLLFACLLVGCRAAIGADTSVMAIDQDSLRGYLAGDYELIGRKADSNVTYTGRVTVRDENGALQVTRSIAGKTEKCTARFDTVGGQDHISVLRMHFQFDRKERDATYLWASDPDNYPRLTGYVYVSSTKSAGLEALFPIHK